MLFKSLIDETISRITGFGSDTTLRNRIKSIINDKYQFIANSAHWRCLQKYQEITIVPNIITGTASVTKGSRVVTISGFTLTSNLAGRFFKHNNGVGWYRISYVDVTNNQLVLESAIAEDTVSGTTYKIWKRYYTLNSNTRVVWQFNSLCSSLNVNNRNYVQDTISATGFYNTYPNTPFTEAGIDEFTTSYSTGSISVTEDSNIATGIGTLWLGNVTPGAKITIGDKVFRVKRIETNTRIVMYNYSDINLNETYTIEEDNPRQIEVLFEIGENSDDVIIPISVISRVYPMLNEDKDYSEFTEDFREALILFSKAEYLSDKADQRATSNNALFTAQGFLQGLKVNVDMIAASYHQFHPTVQAGFGRGNGA